MNERLQANIRIHECLSALESTQLLRLRQMDLFEKTTHCVGNRNSVGNHIVTVRADTIGSLNIGPIILKNSQKQGWFSRMPTDSDSAGELSLYGTMMSIYSTEL